MRCLLCNPPSLSGEQFIREGRCTQKVGYWSTIWPPITLVLAGSLLLEDNHKVGIFDGAVRKNTIEKLIALISSFVPDIIILATSTPTINSDLNLAKELKKKCKAQICLFGVHVSYFYKELMTANQFIDFIMRGEPEIAIKKLLNQLEEKKPELKQIPNLVFRKNNKIIVNKVDLISSLDSLPYPSWHLINLEDYRLPLSGKRFLMVGSSRGCPFKCTFCNTSYYYGNKTRHMSADRVLEEIEYNIKTYNVKDYFFWADTFTINKRFILEFCNKVLARNLKIKWVCNSRIDTIDDQMLKAMKKSGCWMISYGIESVDNEVLKANKKKITFNQIADTVNKTKESGILSTGHFILGLPGDSIESIEKTIEWATCSPLDFAQFYSAVPFPGSELYEIFKSKNIISEESINWTDLEQKTHSYSATGLKKEFIEEKIKYAYKKFYNLKRIFFYISRLKLRALIKNFRDGLHFWRFLYG